MERALEENPRKSGQFFKFFDMRLKVAKKYHLLILIFGFGIFIIIPQMIQHQRTIKFFRRLPPKTMLNPNETDSTIARECLKDLKNPHAKLKFQEALKGDTNLMISVLMEYLPHCAKHPPRKFIAYFIELISNTLDDEEKEDFEFESPWGNRTHFNNRTIKNLCPELPPLLQGRINITFNDTGEITENDHTWNWPPTLEEVALEYQEQIKIGGYYKPHSCKCRGFSALIIPFRDREQHLRFFLHYTHDLLWRQQLCYVIVVVEQGDDKTFNKGQLMNTGFYVAKNLSKDIDCFIFHDVDVIAEDDRIIYTCRDGKTVNHIAPYIDKYKYNFCCGITVGAAVGFTRRQFEDLNGFSNQYAGWGGEDDDMNERIKMKGYEIWRSERNFTRFKMIVHSKDVRNPDNDDRLQLLENATHRQPYDGLNSLQTTITSVIRYPTHTRVKVGTSRADSRILPET